MNAQMGRGERAPMVTENFVKCGQFDRENDNFRRVLRLHEISRQSGRWLKLASRYPEATCCLFNNHPKTKTYISHKGFFYDFIERGVLV